VVAYQILGWELDARSKGRSLKQQTSSGTQLQRVNGRGPATSQQPLQRTKMSATIQEPADPPPAFPNDELVRLTELLQPLSFTDSDAETKWQTLLEQQVQDNDDEEEVSLESSVPSMEAPRSVKVDVEDQLTKLEELRARKTQLHSQITALSVQFRDMLVPKLHVRRNLANTVEERQSHLREISSQISREKEGVAARERGLRNARAVLPGLQSDLDRWSALHGIMKRTLRVAVLRQQSSKAGVDAARKEQDANAQSDRDIVATMKRMLNDLAQLHTKITTGKAQVESRVKQLEKAFQMQATLKASLASKLDAQETMKAQLAAQAETWKQAYLPELIAATDKLTLVKTARDARHASYMAQLDWENVMLDMEDIRNNVERDVSVPDWSADPATWADRVAVHQTRFDIDPTHELSWDKPMKLVPCIVSMSIWIARKPFDCGTFRQAYYAMDDARRHWVVKRFHLERSRQIDATSAERIVRENRLVHATIKQFEADLLKRGKRVELNYIDVYMLTEMHSPRVWMMEELLEQWDRFQNNQDYVAPGPAGELFSAHSHYTYETYDKRMIVTDHQGHPISETEYLLSDPGIHLLQPELGLFQSIHTDLGANRGVSGERDFVMFHQCSPVCKLLGLKPLSSSSQNTVSPLLDSDSDSES